MLNIAFVGAGSVEFRASSGMSLSGLDIDAGKDGSGTRGQINFSSDFGSLEIRD